MEEWQNTRGFTALGQLTDVELYRQAATVIFGADRGAPLDDGWVGTNQNPVYVTQEFVSLAFLLVPVACFRCVSVWCVLQRNRMRVWLSAAWSREYFEYGCFDA